MDNTTLFFTIFNTSRKFPVLDSLMIFGAENLIFLVFISLFILGISNKFKSRPALITSLIAIPISLLLIQLVHLFLNVPRPFIAFPITPLVGHEADPSFPSTHTTIISAIAFSYKFVKSKLTPYLFMAVAWIGLSRVYVGVHFPLDIVGGILTGFTGSSLAWLLGQRLLLPHLSRLFQRDRE